MKRVPVFSAAIALGLTNIAGAADLPLSAPIVAPIPYSWTGIYLGINGGTGWGDKQYSWDQNATLDSLTAQGLLIGTLPPNHFAPLASAKGSHPISGGFFGGQFGANWQVGWAVFGLQTDAHLSNIDGSGSCFNSGFFTFYNMSFNCDDKISSFGTVTGRVGVAIDRALIYAKGGWAWESGKQTRTQTGTELFLFNPLFPDFVPHMNPVTVNQFRSGITFGAGVEYAFAPNWSAFIEYDYLDFGTKLVSTTQRFDYCPTCTLNFVIPAQVTEHYNLIKAGLNYKFNWWSAPGPVVVRY